MKQIIRRHRGGSEEQEVGSDEMLLKAHLAAHLSATQPLRSGWPPQGGWPQEALWRATGAMFIG